MAPPAAGDRRVPSRGPARGASALRAGLVALALALLAAPPAAGQDPEEPPEEDRPVLTAPDVVERGAEPEGPPDAPPPPGPEEELPEVLLPEIGEAPPELPETTEEPPGPLPFVRGIEVRSDTPLGERDLTRIRDLLTLEVGERFSDALAARSLRNLEASGIASRIDLLTRPSLPVAADEEEGVVVVVALRANLIVDEVRIAGDTGGVDSSELRSALYQREGDPLIETRLLRGFYRLQEIFEERGFFEAVVRLEPRIDEEANRATVVYEVEAGPRYTVGAVGYDGSTAPFAPAQLTERLRSKPGEPYRAARAEDDADRLREWLISEGHRAAEVDEPRREIDRARDAVYLTFPLEVGPRVEVEVVGADAKKLEKRDLLPLLGDEGYDEALLLSSQDRIRDHYQEQGHYDVEVTADETLADGVLRVTLTVEPGPVYELEEVDLAGNETFSDDRLRELMETAESGFLSILPGVSGGRLVSDRLDADLDNLRAFYALQGFPDARVGPPRIDRDGAELRVTIPIVEGERRLVSDLAFEGIEAFDPRDVEVPIERGGPYHPRLVEDALNRIRARYDREGYDAAQVSATLEWDEANRNVDVLIRALEGPQTLVDRVIVRGNDRTEEEVIRKAISLKTGEPASFSRLLEVERDLYRLGIFSRVEVDLTPAPLGESTRDVVIRVEEGRVRRLTYGAGYDSDDGFGGLVGFTHQNVMGKAISATVDARVRQRAQQYRVFVEQPYVGNYAIPVSYSLFRLEEDRESFSVLKWGGRVEGLKEFVRGPRETVRYGLAYDYRIVVNMPGETGGDALDPGDPEFQRSDQTLQVSSLVPSVLLDRRDDPLNPTRGWNSLVQLQYAFPIASAEADFLKLFLQHTHYIAIGGRTTLVASARAGGIEPQDLPDDIIDPLIPECPPEPGDAFCVDGESFPSLDVFIAERFFTGGSASHRGYRLDRLGVPATECPQRARVTDDECAATLFRDDEGDLEPAGGNGLALINLEYRFPVFGPVDGAVFFDSGNVWADWRQIDVSDFRHGAGVGVRYVSPIGPIRLDVGFPLDRIEGEDSVVYFLSLGYPF